MRPIDAHGGVKVDPATEGWYAETTARLGKINHDAAFLIQNKRTDDAAALINAGIPMQARLLTAHVPPWRPWKRWPTSTIYMDGC